MDPTAPRPPGFFDSLCALGGALLAPVQDRVALFTVELEEEKLRLIQSLVWTGAAVFTAFMAFTFGSLLVVYLCWETARLAALIGLTAFYFGALAALLWSMRRWFAQQPKPFAATLRAFGGPRAVVRPAT